MRVDPGINKIRAVTSCYQETGQVVSCLLSCDRTGQETTPIGKCLLRHQEASCHQETKILLSTGQEDSCHKPTGGDPSPVGLPKVNLTIGLGRVWAPPKVLQSGVNIRK